MKLNTATREWLVRLVTRTSYIVSPVAAANAAVWTPLTMLGGSWKPIRPQTLTATLVQSAPQTGTLQLRVVGLLPTGEQVTETTPIVAVPAKATTYVHLAIPFETVISVEYKASTMSVGATIAVGFLNSLLRTTTGIVEHVAPRNWGFWFGRDRVRPSPDGDFYAVCPGDEDDPDFMWGQAHNFTTGRPVWLDQGAVVVADGDPAWPIYRDKLSFVADKFIDGHGLTAYAEGDLLEIRLSMLASDDP